MDYNPSLDHGQADVWGNQVEKFFSAVSFCAAIAAFLLIRS